MKDILKIIRVRQWTKNFFVFIPMFFDAIPKIVRLGLYSGTPPVKFLLIHKMMFFFRFKNKVI